MELKRLVSLAIGALEKAKEAVDDEATALFPSLQEMSGDELGDEFMRRLGRRVF